MKKSIWLGVSMLLLAFLAACGTTETSIPVDEVGPEVGASPQPAAEVNEAEQPPAEDNLDPFLVRDRDWTKGATDPAVTIIEYGDFQ